MVETLRRKMSQMVFDAGETFQVEQHESECEDGCHERACVALVDVTEANVWIVDHFLSFRMGECRACVGSAHHVLER